MIRTINRFGQSMESSLIPRYCPKCGRIFTQGYRDHKADQVCGDCFVWWGNFRINPLPPRLPNCLKCDFREVEPGQDYCRLC